MHCPMCRAARLSQDFGDRLAERRERRFLAVRRELDVGRDDTQVGVVIASARPIHLALKAASSQNNHAWPRIRVYCGDRN
jgi:hypothetical protein